VKKIFVTKFDGRKEEFQKQKIINTCIRAGASEEISKKIADEIEKIAYDGITTKEIYENIKKLLEKYEKRLSSIYGLRESISTLDPLIFEVYVKRILENYNYVCEYNKIISGACVEHQVDIVARSEKNELILVECKRHENPHRFCGLDVCLQVQARLEDLKDGFQKGFNNYNFTSAWIITNTKFSEHAKIYSSAKKIKLTGWRYPENEGLEQLIERKKLYPISILKTKKQIIQKIFNNGIILLKELEKEKLKEIGIKESIINGLLKQKEEIIKE